MSFHGKRRRDDDEDDGFEQRAFNRPQHFAKRARQELSQELQLAIKLCEDITKLGEKSLQTFNNDINYMSFPISEEISESDEIRNAVLKTIFSVIVEQPHKLQFVFALIKICNLRNKIVGQYVFEYLHQRAQELINDSSVEESGCGNLNKLKLILRFFAISRGLIEDDSVFKIFEQFLKLSVELQKEERNSVLELLFYNCVISIPYLKYNGESEENLSILLRTASEFKNVQAENSKMFEHFDNSMTLISKPYESKYLIDLVLPAVSGVEDLPLLEIEKMIEPLVLEISEANEQTKHSLPPFSLSADKFAEWTLSGYIDSLWKNPRVILEVYLAQNHGFETKPPLTSYFGLLLSDMCQDIIQSMEFNKIAVAQQLLSLDQFFKEKTFAKAGSSIDKLMILNDKKSGVTLELDDSQDESSKLKFQKLLEEIDGDYENGYVSTWKVEDIITESILNLIFNLPDVSNPIIYFYTVLVECCNKESKSMAPVFGRAIRFFFSNIILFDFELRSRYLDWLLVQLSNFRFQWKWHEWSEYVDKLKDLKFHPIMIFIKNLIAKEIRLSSVKKIRDTLPEIFYPFLDISLNDEEYVVKYDTEVFGKYWEQAILEFKFGNSENEYLEPSQKLFNMLQSGGIDVDNVKEVLKELPNDRYIINCLMQSSCIIGSRSISHARVFFDTNREKLTQIIDSLASDAETKKEWIVESVLRVWNHEPQIGYLVLEMLLMGDMISGEVYLKKLFENDSILLNISGMESMMRVLSNLDLYHIEADIFEILFKEMQSKLQSLTEKIGEDGAIEIGNGEDVSDEKWCYFELMKLIKSTLRKFDCFRGKELVVQHSPTKETLLEYV